MLPIMILQDASALWVYRKDWSGRILAIIIPGGIIGIVIAAFLAAHVSNAAVRTFVGAITVAFVLYYWAGMMQRAARALKARHRQRPILGGAGGLHLDAGASRRAALPDLRAELSGCRR